MKTNIYLTVSLWGFFACYCQNVFSQQDNRVVQSGAAFLMLSADARNSSVAEAGTGLNVDANALYINPAKITFGEPTSISASYTSWMRQVSKDSHLGYISAYRKLNDREAIGISIKYLDLGSISFRDDAGGLINQYKANEFSIDASYARKFGETFGMALTARYFRSDIGKGTYNNIELNPTDAFAADISIYSNRELQDGQYSRSFNWGINLSNLGSKLKYSDNQASFLPTNLRIGAGYNFYAAPESRLTLLLDINKLMIPTPPRYKKDTDGNFNREIEKGKDPNRSVTSALFTSLFDAPGGFKEELSEFTIAGGLEFSYYNRFFIRTGYFYENPEKGNRQHIAAGLGLNINPIRIDVSYISPTENRYVLRNSMRFTLSFTPGAGKTSWN
ncbi:type IX secretion system outer membrane channel protein PorV [Pedobacter sp. B4-66]|uniref:type IX secretion system outer membrane channel protein PorV n=1 Tax=Pedobacter sp. B4-66 TaxID=2817280 RepID=UPI001BDB343F|nr:type IX secretion system outer membrane channel protein PorV [Pedobacter sp. B4-66]